MPVVIPNAFDSAAVLTGLQLDENSQAVEDYTSSIPGSDLQDATVANTKLINKHYEFLAVLRFRGTQAVHATIPRDFVLLPGTATTEVSYTVLSAGVAYSAHTGTNAVTWGVQFGSFVTGTWTERTAAGADVIATASSGTITNNYIIATPTVLTSALPLSDTEPRGLGLIVTNKGSFADIDDELVVTLKIKRTDGLRA